MLIVTRLDRLVRSTRDLLNVIAALADRVCHARGRSPEGQEAEGRPCRMIFRSRMQRLPLRYAVKTWPGSPAIFFTRLYLNHDVSSDWIKIEAFNLNCGGPFWSDHSDIAAAAPVARNSAAIPPRTLFSLRYFHITRANPVCEGLCACPCCQEQRSDTGYEKAGTHHFVHHHSGSGHPVLAGVRGLCAGADQ